jgi:hypothetical protein
MIKKQDPKQIPTINPLNCYFDYWYLVIPWLWDLGYCDFVSLSGVARHHDAGKEVRFQVVLASVKSLEPSWKSIL